MYNSEKHFQSSQTVIALCYDKVLSVRHLFRGVSDAAELDRNPGCNSQFHVRPFFPCSPSVFQDYFCCLPHSILLID